MERFYLFINDRSVREIQFKSSIKYLQSLFINRYQYIEMSREFAYNPLAKLLQGDNQFYFKNISTKLFSPASSKQDFFTLKRNHNKKLSQITNAQYQKRRLSLDKKQSSDCSKQSWDEMNISQQVFLNNYVDDDVKTTSTKSYDTHQEIQISKATKSKKKNHFQMVEAGKTINQNQDKVWKFSQQKQDKLVQNCAFKSQFFDLNILQLPQKKQKVNKSDILLKFNYNTKKKIVLPLKIKQFLLFPQPIGTGTYSKVYKAIHKKTGMVCAIKVIQKQQIARSNLTNNLIEQIKIMLTNQHENITKLWGFFDEGPKFYMIMQYCTDGQLYKLIKNFKPQQKTNKHTFLHKLSCIRQVCLAIENLHQNKIMHRDVKPQNILLNMSKTIKLSDFGWAKMIQNPGDQLRKTLCGTPLYLAPEQIKQCQYSKSVDLWAIGILTFQLLTGKIPFIIESIEDLHKIVNEQVKLSDLDQFPYAADFVSLLLEKDGEKRVQIQKLSDHKFFEMLEQLDEQSFLYELQFGKIV